MNTATAVRIPLKEVVSSQIHSIGHDPVTKTLAIRFKKNGAPSSLYHYDNFTATDFAHFKGAASIGSYFYKNIKPDTARFPFTKIDESPEEPEAA